MRRTNSPEQRTDKVSIIRYARPREPSMLGTMRSAAHLQKEEAAAASTHTPATENTSVCVCVCKCL